MASRPRSILITGASSGIGTALAQLYAAPGIRLALGGRNEERLEKVAAACRARGADVSAKIIDVRERGPIAAWIRAADDEQPIDLAIASAGITSGLGLGRLREDPEAVRAMLSINLMGVINTAEPVIERLCRHGSGRIALMGSIAAIRGLPSCPAYCAAKAAVHAYAEALRGGLASQGVGVSLIVPGFVATALNQDIVSPKPLQISAERAAAIIRRGLDRGKPVIAFPRLLYYGATLLRVLPVRWGDAIFNRAHVDIPETLERAFEPSRETSRTSQ